MSKNFLISDTHFGHNGISERFRTHFTSDVEHHDSIHHSILECSGKRNTLLMGGDNVFKVSEFWRLEAYAKRYQRVFVCLGNHDHKSLPKFLAQFDNVYMFGIIKMWDFWHSHAPMHPTELYGKPNIHGHTHGKNVDDPRYFNISCENINYEPIELQHLIERMKPL